MEPLLDLVIINTHADGIRALLDGRGSERAAYLLMGRCTISADPWSESTRLRLVSHRFIEIPEADIVSWSPSHVTWSTTGFMRLLGEAQSRGLIPAIVHTHPGGQAFFSDQDDRNERELARTVLNKGLPGFVSIVIGQQGEMRARFWTRPESSTDATHVLVTGRRLHLHRHSSPEAEPMDTHLDRQARLFGYAFNGLMGHLRVAVVGCGGTGSAVAMLLARLGIGKMLLVDRDRLETTNLNRVHGSRRADVIAKRHKSTMLADTIRDMDLGVDAVALTAWVGDPAIDDALKSCDVIFGCTDDHAGRALLNRLAYFHGIPLVDIGLSMRAATGERRADVTGRVSTHFPGHACMMCSGLVNPRLAGEQALERNDPSEYARRKAEAYVIGSGDPAPAVVTFTTEIATMAVNELIDAVAGFRPADGFRSRVMRKFHDSRDVILTLSPGADCPSCNGERWGRGDLTPFLDMVR